MNADPFELLVDAYRAETAHRDRDAGALRARVLVTVGRRRKSHHRLVWLAAAAVVFVGSAAMAAGGGRENVTRLVSWIRSEVSAKNTPQVRQRRYVPRAAPIAPVRTAQPARIAEPAPPAQNVELAPPARAAEPAEPARPVEPAAPARIVIPLSALPVVEPHTDAKRRSAVRGASTAAPPAAAAPDLGSELSLYQRAHALHFGGGDPAEALDAWRLYLGTHPGGALAAEARLNEAVCLMKLRRWGEGRRVLESLATANAPPSTRQQARELLLILGPDERRVNP
jgi:hypothetical protein